MASFPIAYNRTMGNEGGYANNPLDRGKETYKGISSVNFPKWEGWKIIDSIKNKFGNNPNIINEQGAKNDNLQLMVRNFYKVNFWDVYSLDQVNDQSIANEMFDTGVNMGVGIESKFLQRALNVTNLNGRYFKDLEVDGDIGPITLSALNNHPNKKLVLKVLNILQGARYIDIAERDPSQEVFMASWLSRVEL